MTLLPSESDDLVALSGLQHLIFCERQAALIHVERLWREDGATASGRIFHERADLPGTSSHEDVRTERSVTLASQLLGLFGRADVVEYHRDPSVAGGWRPHPVEYKRGRTKEEPADQVQVCAQAMCLEEMHGVQVETGSLFYGESHRRLDVRFGAHLRARTVAAAMRLHELIRTASVPRVAEAPKCRRCSLRPDCRPDVTADAGGPGTYLDRLVRSAGEPEP